MIRIKKEFIIEKFKLYPLTYTLMILNILIFIVPQIFTVWFEPIYQEGALNGYWVVIEGQIYRLLTSIFLHADAMHIVMNMLSIYMVGTMVERLFSKTIYLGIYFISGLFGSFLSMYVHTEGWAVGASGAIFGIFGALAGFAWIHRQTMRTQFIDFMKNFGVILLINLGIGLLFPSVDMSAHIGGLVAGLAGGMVVAKNPKYLWAYLVVSVALLVGAYGYLSSLYM